LLQIGRIIILLDGYKPDDGEQHKTTFVVAGEILGKEYQYLINKLQKYRVKRNVCIYEPKDLVSKSDVEAIYRTSREFWNRVRLFLQKKNPQLKLFKDI